jgi:hypothetical protein
MSIIDQEIEKLRDLFQLAQQVSRSDPARLMLKKTSLLYSPYAGTAKQHSPTGRCLQNQAVDLEEETRPGAVLYLGAKYGSPDLERSLYKSACNKYCLRDCGITAVICQGSDTAKSI